RNNALPFRQLGRRRRQPSEHRRERSEQSETARCASSPKTQAASTQTWLDKIDPHRPERYSGRRGEMSVDWFASIKATASSTSSVMLNVSRSAAEIIPRSRGALRSQLIMPLQ